MDKDVSAVKQCGITSIITLISNIVILVVVPPYMFSIHKGIAVSNIILLVIVPFISRILGKLIQETSSQVLEGYNSITSVLTNTYDNWFITRLFQCGQYVHDRYFEKNQKYKKETNRQNLLYILNTSTILVIQFIGTVIIWVVGAQEVFKGNMTIGTIMALMNYQTIIMNPIIGIAQFANEYHTAVVSLKDINGLLQYPDQKQGDRKKITTVNNISLEAMSFSYPESNKKVFDRLNLNFEKGTLYGVHGKSGQGKSTLFKIITGVYQPTVRRNMGLLHTVSEEEMDMVAKCLDLYDEMHTLEMVWDTEIKIDPCNFSEGQMRRLDIMRNILKNSQILIFDEATANIDEKRRGRFYQLLHELSREKIIIFSTHNLEELREADIIVDLEKMHIRQVSEK